MSKDRESIERDLEQAVEHQQAGRTREAERLYRAILRIAPGQPEANHNLGRIALDAGRGSDALMHLKTALEADPTVPHVWLSYIDALIRLGHRTTARQLLDEGKRRGLAGDALVRLERRLAEFESRAISAAGATPAASPGPSHPGTIRPIDKGPGADEISAMNALFDQQDYAALGLLASLMTQRHPNHPLGWKMLGRALTHEDRNSEAMHALAEASRLAPTDSEAHAELALALEAGGRLGEAERHLRAAERIRPDDADIQNNLGVLLGRAGRSSDAEPCLRRALALRTVFPEAQNNLGLLLQRTGRLKEAESCFREALRSGPDFAGALSNLGGLCQATGRMTEAEECFRRAISIEPTNLDWHSNLLFCQSYAARHAPQQCLDDARRFGRTAQAKARSPYMSWPRAQAAERLRVGFVSGDLRNHPVGFFLENLLEHLAGSRLDLLAYPTVVHSDALTSRIQRRFRTWKPLYGLSDQAAAEMIHGDGVHVLVDLSGHSGQNRLAAFAWKPAPVQVSWLGYFATTGMPQMHYLLADAVSVPPQHHDHFTETIWYLPETRLCFSPPRVDVPVAPLPALANGYITFANFQNLAKLGADVLALWSQVLSRCPAARLRVQNEQLADATVRQQFGQRLQQAGVAAERVTLHGAMPRDQYLAAHAEVDLVLDSFPFPGGTTTCEALWMGVPTLTLAGDRLISRQGASLLTAAGLPGWIAHTPVQFVDKAVAFASDIPALATLRARLRAQVLDSPLFDAARFARHFETALWAMWQRSQSGVR